MDLDLTRQQDRIKYLVPQGSKYIITPLQLSNHESGASAVVNAVWDTGATRSAVSTSIADYLNLEKRGKGYTTGIGGKVGVWLALALAFPGNADWYTIANPIVAQLPASIDFLIGLDIITLGDFSLKHRDNGTLLEFIFDQEYFVNINTDSVKTAMEKISRANDRLKSF